MLSLAAYAGDRTQSQAMTGSTFQQVKVDGQPVQALLDTGSTVTIIHPKLLKNKILQTSRFPLMTVTAERVAMIGQCEVNVKVGGHRTVMLVWAAEIPECCLIGIDFLHKAAAIVDLGTATLTLAGKCAVPIFFHSNLPGPPSHYVHSLNVNPPAQAAPTLTSSNWSTPSSSSAFNPLLDLVFASVPSPGCSAICSAGHLQEDESPTSLQMAQVVSERSGQGLTEPQQQELWRMLERHHAVFATSASDVDDAESCDLLRPHVSAAGVATDDQQTAAVRNWVRYSGVPLPSPSSRRRRNGLCRSKNSSRLLTI
ncbi:hypothetical protein IRJ41_012617 [Triplophysa rosa]|uniref:Peptidase A2 domain-containing protein n=1 Tax=Triplophysa rosa TaxID=992332 RepID=A0A9W7WNX1_TRIRA|nr:hypothetical protein IRJ41_012617 [Triplophysa rosa]